MSKEDELFEAMFIKSLSFIGTKQYDRLQEIISKYPEEFPWETKYRSIPKETHEAFNREWEKEGREIAQEDDFPDTSHLDPIESIFKISQYHDRRRLRLLRRQKQIWNRHYKPYGLNFRS